MAREILTLRQMRNPQVQPCARDLNRDRTEVSVERGSYLVPEVILVHLGHVVRRFGNPRIVVLLKKHEWPPNHGDHGAEIIHQTCPYSAETRAGR